VRLTYGPWVRQPLRVVLDSMLRCAPSAKIFSGGGALVFAAADAPPKRSDDIRVERVARAPGGLDLHAVMQRLAALEVNELLLECGATLAGAFIATQLVDELVLYVAPKLLGADAAPLLQLRGAGLAGSLPAWELRGQQRCGDDLRLILGIKAS
jgi:diaminohydroxyphosphoribosylaminopyrimidine deaminase/5-amino-6-(5-phosphoribosylamino)uracil reductase